MIDFHTHILPNIDDGARDMETSVKMLLNLEKQGIYKVVLTPHFYANEISISKFLKKRDESYKLLSGVFKSKNMKLVLGAEVYLTDCIFNNESIDDLCIGDSRYILLELPYIKKMNDKILLQVNKLINDYLVIPVLAHVDRYDFLLNNTKVLNEFINLGCLCQLNLNSLDSSFLKRGKVYKLIEKGFINVLGTDCHNIVNRLPEYQKYLSLLKKHISEKALTKLFDCQNHITKQIKFGF